MYTVKVGPYTIRVDDKGRHEVIGKDKKEPMTYYYKDGYCHIIHIATADLKPEPRP